MILLARGPFRVDSLRHLSLNLGLVLKDAVANSFSGAQ